MKDQRDQLLEYVRVLYERWNSGESKKGTTRWAVLAGLIYVIWHFIGSVTQISHTESDRAYFYDIFMHVHLSLLSLTYLIYQAGSSSQKQLFDYRILKVNTKDFRFIFLIILLVPLLYCITFTDTILIKSTFHKFQDDFNYWFIILFLTLSFLVFTIEQLRVLKAEIPFNVGLVEQHTLSFKIYTFLIFLLITEIFIANISITAVEVFGNTNKAIIFTAAFDLSLIILGIFYLVDLYNIDFYLKRLSKLERDIVLHELNEAQIKERLQDELLGIYIGDWLENRIKKIKSNRELLQNHINDADTIIEEISTADVNSKREKMATVKIYIDKLHSYSNDYNNSVTSLLDWLKSAALFSYTGKDEFIKSIVEDKVKVLGNDLGHTTPQVKITYDKFREWLQKSD